MSDEVRGVTVGKTTIMMHIHNRLLKDATFDGVLFITVSQDSSIYKLQSDIWKALKFGVMEDEHEMKRAAMLMKHLERKKNCVLILDDVRQHFKLQDVGITDRAGLKVVLTSHVSAVCSRMECEEIEIQPLGGEEAWKLFVEELGPKLLTDIPVEKVARKITNRCAGLPLAANTMASSMRGEKNFCVWQDTLNKLERSHTEHIEMGDKVFPVLTLSYERLSDPQVKQCFLFCALFPEDESIKQMQLIEYFIDEGFLGESYTREEQYYRGLAIVDMLRKACLLEVNYGRVRVHDLIRHMALHIMSTTCMVKAGEGLQIMPNGEYWTKDLEKVSLMRCWIDDILPDMSPNCPRLSTLLLNGSPQLENMQLQDSFFIKLRGLKVLNLSGCAIRKLPDSVSELANLKALLLRNCRLLDRTPYLGKLKSLRKLDANGCTSLLAVEGLEELRNLRYLDLSETGIERLLEGTLRRMVNLQYLKIAGRVKAEEVMQLKALERLDCNFGNDDFNKYVTFMQRSGRHDYRLIVDQEKSLWFVTAYVYSDPKNFPKIKIKDDDDYHDYSKYVQIRSCNHAMARVGEESYNDSILIPRDAEFIMMRNWRGMTNLSGGVLLRCLRRLEITECDNLVVLCGGAGVDEEVRNTQDSPAPLFPSLETLEIRRCSKLKYLFGHEYRFSVPLLREVFIYQCEGIEGMTTSVASPPQLGGPAFPRLEHIDVENCGNIKRVVGSEWLPHFSNLMRITIKDCNNIRELLPRECLLHLSNLKHIKVSSCEGIEEITSGGGENHRGSAPLNTHSSSLPSPFSPLKLKILVLYQLPQLKSIGEGALTFIPGAIVSVHDCPQLRSVPPYMSRRVQVGEFLQIQKDGLRRLLDMSMRDQAGESLQNQEDVLRRIGEFLQIQEDVSMKQGEFLPIQENVIRRLSDFLRIQEDELRTPDRFLQMQKDLLKSLRESVQIKEDELGRLLPEDELGRLLQEDDLLRRLLQIQEDELRTPGEFLRIGEDLLGIVHESSRFCTNELRRLLDIGLEEDELRRPGEFLGIEEFLQIQKDGLRRLCTFLQM